MTDQLIKLNSLQLNQKNIWTNPGNAGEFDYSDGVDEERYLIEVLTQTENLQLGSADLRKACRDWVAEYHLGSVRANLLANLNFPKQARVLEVGCGCGAITRYIGELGLKVDAIEGSPVRAEIAQLRNRDLPGVNIIQHNFNTLDLPTDNYDVVLFIGVLEYAKRFIDNEQSSSEQAVVSLLKKASASLTKHGKIIIAIENRIGYKYRYGAYEDHLARANVGIEDYSGYEFTGIKTYDAVQWQTLIEQSGLTHQTFYPFGDYKFPTVVVQGEVQPAAHAYLASQIHSYDMVSDWFIPEPEDPHWLEALNTNTLREYSNSFGLIVSKDHAGLENAYLSNWSIHDPSCINPSLRLTVTDYDSNYSINNNDIYHCFNALNDINKSISSHWQQQLLEKPDMESLSTLCSQLLLSLQTKWPSNTLVDFDQLFHTKNDNNIAFVKYWDLRRQINPTQQLFHFLFGFLLFHRKLLCRFDCFNYLTMSEIIKGSLAELNVVENDTIEDLLEFEQNYRNLSHHVPGFIVNELDYLFSIHNKFKFKHISSQLFCPGKENEFNLHDSISQRIKQTGQLQSLNFNQLNTSHPWLRFDPCDHEHGQGHYCHIHSIKFTNDSVQLLDSLEMDTMTFSDLRLIDESKFIFKVTGIDPQIKFQLPKKISHSTSRYQLDIQLQWLGV